MPPLRRTLIATAIATLGASPAGAVPNTIPSDLGGALQGGVPSAEGGAGGPQIQSPDLPGDGILFAHGKKKLYRFVEGGEGGEGGEGSPVIVRRRVHRVPLAVSIIGGPIAVILEPDWPVILAIEPQIVVAPIGTVIPWSNSVTGHYGEVAVIDEGLDDQMGGYCRSYRTTVVIDGRPETATGTACQLPDGTWKIVR